MPRTVVGGLIQMSNPVNDPAASVTKIRDAMLDKHLPVIEEAGKQGVQILCLQEIFNGPYFCPSQDAKWCDIAEPIPGPTIELMQQLRQEARDGHHRADLRAGDGRRLLQQRRRDRRRRQLPRQVPQEPHPPHGRILGEVLLQAGQPRAIPCFRPATPPSACTSATTATSPRARGCSACTAPRSSSTPRRRWRGCRSTSGSSSSRPTPWPTATSWAASTGSAPRPPGTSASSTARATSWTRAATSWRPAARTKDELVTAEMDLDLIEEVRRTWQFYRDRRPETYDDMVRQLP